MNQLNPILLKELKLQKVTVTTAARLHMGFVDLNGSQGRLFGSLGLALQAPTTKLTVFKSEKTLIDAKNIDYVAKIAENFKNQLKISINFSIKVEESIPEHAGLGSGTQMALAVGAGINALFNLNLTTAELAAISSRGRRSGVGIGTFEQGGLVLDGGTNVHHQHNRRTPPIIARHVFPQQWPVLLILDYHNQGLSGDAELQAFEALSNADLVTAQALSHRVLMQALPAIVEHDYAQFSQAIHALQLATGAYFSAAQGGHYKSAKVAEVLHYLHAKGIVCAGQSSWGPTGFAIFEDETKANAMLTQLQSQFLKSNLHFQLMQAKNNGADIDLS